jgi:hypothetical protein
MPKASLSSKLKKAKKVQSLSVWKGPSVDDPNGGVTQSMLNSFMVCRERFRVKYVLGLQPTDTFNHRIEYGSMWHHCEEAWLADSKELCKRYPLQQEEVLKWKMICRIQFLVYVEYWQEHEDQVNVQPIDQELTFSVPYKLYSGRTVYMRGKFDAINELNGRLWLQENKTKGDIDPVLMQRQLQFDLQTMFYLTAMTRLYNGMPLGGVHYNVIRRPLSGGKGSIRLKKNQTEAQFYDELSEVITNAKGAEWGISEDDHYFFMRWKVGISDTDLAKYLQTFLDPILEQLCNWWEWVAVDPEHPFRQGNEVHTRSPYGLYSPLYDGKPTDLDEYLNIGTTVGLQKVDHLFRELQ